MADGQRRSLGIDIDRRHIHAEFRPGFRHQKPRHAVRFGADRGAESEPLPRSVFPRRQPATALLPAKLERSILRYHSKRNKEWGLVFEERVGGSFNLALEAVRDAPQRIAATVFIGRSEEHTSE